MLTLTRSSHGMTAIQLHDASKALHAYLRAMVAANRIDDPRYHIRTEAGAFLQGGHDREEGWILIEFWQPAGAQAFVDYANENFQEPA